MLFLHFFGVFGRGISSNVCFASDGYIFFSPHLPDSCPPCFPFRFSLFHYSNGLAAYD